ncbi:hypothetical protein [Shewanella youngdeokensis]|uniref:Transporter n=1 Tax=Shewanella youngdeokensis TaxID=2999068 RepID=A0ABZ0JUQ4_9GAMM|nr:hypothetical protein RGE70_11930 [Shewanella sp. DAU334]
MAFLRYFSISLILLSFCATAETDYHHYAFANYLGSGVYRTEGQNATVVNIPLSFDLHRTETESVVLHTPLSLGFVDFTWRDIPDGDLPTSVGTATLTPGVEYRVQTSSTHEFQAYTDLGVGANSTNGHNVLIYSAGMSSLLELDFEQSKPVWVNRVFFAGYNSFDDAAKETYSAVQSGFDVGTNYHFQVADVGVEPRLFVVGYWYFDKLRFVTPFNEDVMIKNSLEAGVTFAFSRSLGWELFNISHLGLSYRAGDGIQAWRLIFDFPI